MATTTFTVIYDPIHCMENILKSKFQTCMTFAKVLIIDQNFTNELKYDFDQIYMYYSV